MFGMTAEQILKRILIIAGIAGGLFLFPFLLKAFAPFVAAFLIAVICQRLVRFLEKRLRISRGISSAIIVTAIVAVAIGLILLIISRLAAQARNLITALPDAISSFRFHVNSFLDRCNGMKVNLSPESAGLIDNLILKFETYAAEISEKATNAALNTATHFAMALPGITVFLIMLILGTFFFIKDYPLVINFAHELFPKRITDFFSQIKSITGNAFSSYLKAQLHLMLITSLLVTVSLWIIGKNNTLLWGIICGLVDALPLLGTAAILIPWALISFVYGDMYSFSALLIIQGLVFLVRQLIEPKILSRHIGIHPILTLISIYIGLKYFGIIGVILTPIVTLIFVNLYVTYKERQ